MNIIHEYTSPGAPYILHAHFRHNWAARTCGDLPRGRGFRGLNAANTYLVGDILEGLYGGGVQVSHGGGGWCVQVTELLLHC